MINKIYCFTWKESSLKLVIKFLSANYQQVEISSFIPFKLRNTLLTFDQQGAMVRYITLVLLLICFQIAISKLLYVDEGERIMQDARPPLPRSKCYISALIIRLWMYLFKNCTNCAQAALLNQICNSFFLKKRFKSLFVYLLLIKFLNGPRAMLFLPGRL